MTAGVYLHIPFCKSRCSYCDFATDVYRSSDAVEKYVNALCVEIESFGDSNPKSEFENPNAADTIYFGGGTPSLLRTGQVARILETVKKTFDLSLEAEITMEMNPGTVTAETLAGYWSLGVNRASFGVQTFNDQALRLLARGHDANDARQTFTLLREAGFANISLDLIAGLPNQTLADWKQNLDEALAMQPEHLSLYLLEIHESTPLAQQIRSGRQPLPDDDLAADMYELMIDELTASGYVQYEISNFAKPGFESRHNTKYWRLDPVYGFGVSAHSFDCVDRYSNVRDTARYVEMIADSRSAEVSRERVDTESEFLFLGLRLAQGIDVNDYRRQFGIDFAEKYRANLDELESDGLISRNAQRIQLTRRGMLLSNEVFALFV